MKDIIVSPFSNSDIRDWPASSFSQLIALLIDAIPVEMRIRVTGTRGQFHRACAIVRDFDAERVSNDCGRFAWLQVEEMIAKAACVIGNNSGIAHLAGHSGVPTVCIFGGSHQRVEWRPIGSNVILLSRAIACSPCHLDHRGACPYNKACLHYISPNEVARAALAAMASATEAESQKGEA